MEMMKKNETITSIELVNKINELREKEYQEKAKAGTLTKKENLSGRYSKLRHNDLLKIIRKEFKNKIAQGNISLSKYLDKNNREREMFVLTLSQAKQVLLRESATVREKVIDYIEHLENELKKALERERLQVRVMGKALRNLETSTIQRLLEYGNVPKEKWKLYFANYTMIAYRIMGYKAKPERDEMNAQELNLLQQLETIINVTIIENISKNVPHYLIYQDCRDKATEVFRKVRSLFISEIDKATQKGFELMEQEQLGLSENQNQL